MALDIRRARRHFALTDPVMLALVKRVGPCRLDQRVAPDAFQALLRAIVAQQVSAKAARTVYERVTALVPGGIVTPEVLLALDSETLRATGAITALTDVQGIGRWTAEVFLIFQLQRQDVFPAADLALLGAIQRIYRRRVRPTPAAARQFAERWRPYRSIASWYLWRSLELAPEDLPEPAISRAR
jgi:3-methyladenine DNA glycosylase/8-oxoguanine DNA glycosylase